MSKNINNAISLTSYFITLPSTAYLVFTMIVIGVLFGLIINPGQYSTIDNMEKLYRAIADGLMLLTLPAFLTSIIVKALIIKMPYRRIAATALWGEFIYAIAYSASLLLGGVNPVWAQMVLLIGSAIVFVCWYIIARFVFILKYRSILFAIIQLALYLIFLASNQALYATPAPLLDVALKFYLSSFVLLLGLIVFFMIINAPMKKNLGLSSTDAITYLASQWLYHNKDMEKVFEKVGEEVKTVVSIMAFERANDRIFFVTPCVHYGPFGNLGGSEFSHLIAQELDSRYKKYNSKTFVFHGTVTHDLNPVATSEMEKIMSAIDRSIKNSKFENARVSLLVGEKEECRAQALRINNSAMISLSRAPLVTEDINLGLGLSLMYGAEKRVENAMIVDQHNAETGEITSFEPGSIVGFNYMGAIDDALSKI
ncbi:DUF2070 family protein, partial [Candidatus Micrarchaeota archaeon]|nr:DUF2070 family protein [Candidatus Micrarchaeota archaeon]